MKKLMLLAIMGSTAAYIQSDLDKLLKTKVCVGCDLSDADLSGKDLRKAKLLGANLTKANLSGADLSGAIFYAEEYTGKPRTNLSGANLSNTKLVDADLTGCDLSIFGISRQNLAFNMIPTRIDEYMKRYIIRTNLKQANLTGAKLIGADLLGADLTQTNFTNANLTDADLSSAYFASTNLTNAITSGWKTSEVIFDMQSKSPVIVNPKDVIYIETYRENYNVYSEESKGESLILCGRNFEDKERSPYYNSQDLIGGRSVIRMRYDDMLGYIYRTPNKSPSEVCKAFGATGF